MSDEKKESNHTTAEVSMNIVFDVYDPSTLKKNNFSRQIFPKLAHIKRVLFNEVAIAATSQESRNANAGLECISEFSNSKDEESGKSNKGINDSQPNPADKSSEKPEPPKTTTFCSKAAAGETADPKSFVIDFSRNHAKVEDIDHQEKSSDEKMPWPVTDSDLVALVEEEDEDLYDLINSTHRYRLSVHSAASGYSKENLILDMTPQKPGKSSIHAQNSSDQKMFSDVMPQVQERALNMSGYSRPSFLDRQNSHNNGTKPFDCDRLWEDLSLNTQDLMVSQQDSVMSDQEQQTLADELTLLALEKDELVLSREILREKKGEEAKMFVETMKNFPGLFKETFRRRRKELLQRRKERQDGKVGKKPILVKKSKFGSEIYTKLRFAMKVQGRLKQIAELTKYTDLPLFTNLTTHSKPYKIRTL